MKELEQDLQRVIQVSQAIDNEVEELRSCKDYMDEGKISRLEEKIFMLG